MTYGDGLVGISFFPTWTHQTYELSTRLMYIVTPCQHWWSMIRHNNNHSNTKGITTVLPRSCFSILPSHYPSSVRSALIECVSQTSSSLMISFRALVIIHIPHSGKNKQQPWLHLISASLQITHPRDYRQLGKRGTPLHVLDLSCLPHRSCFVCVRNSNTTKGRNSQMLSELGSGGIRKASCCQSCVSKDSMWFHFSQVAEKSRLWLLIGPGEKQRVR